MLAKIKLALRLTGSTFDTEIQSLIDDCLAELTMLGIYRITLVDDPQILSAVTFYCKARFGDNPDAAKWEQLYHDKVTKLQVAFGYGLGGEA